MGLNGKEFAQLLTGVVHGAYINLNGIGQVVPLKAVLDLLTKFVDGRVSLTIHPDGRIDYSVSTGDGACTGDATPQSHAPAKVLSIVKQERKEQLAPVQEQPRDGAIPADAESLPASAFPRNGKLCSVCRGPQYLTPHGESCDKGHGGAPSIEPDDQ